MNMLKVLLALVSVNAGSAADYRSPLFPERNFPEIEKINMLQHKLNAIQEETSDSTESGKKILIVGDSWADVVATGSVLGESFFTRKLREHSCSAKVRNIAVPGTMVSDWNADPYLKQLKSVVKSYDYVWISLLGNDALIFAQDCAQQNRTKTAEECGDEVYQKTKPAMSKLLDTIHEANPNARVVGFGYDTMFGGLGCSFITHAMFPQCYKLFHSRAAGNRCFNTQFLRIQEIWDDMAASKSWVDSVNIIGLTQMKGGDSKASIGHPDMDKMGPAKYWPDYEGCFHPSVYSSEKDGSASMIIMEEFYKQYWGKQLGCANGTHYVESLLV